MTKVALYLRKSREDEENKEITLERHETMLLEYCARNNLSIVKTYKEVVSGENIENRPEMKKLLDDTAAKLYDGVVCVELERLSRGNVVDQVEILDVFKASGTKIYTLNKVYDLTKEEIDEEYFEFALFMSRREYKTINRRLQRGRMQATKDGYYAGAILPYGYTKEKQENGFVLIPNENEAKVVKYIFEQYAQGVTANQIVTNLNAQGSRNRKGTYWRCGRVTELLRNKIYAGMIHSTKLNTWVQGKHEAIIDLTTFNKVQEMINSKMPKVKHDLNVKNPLSGIVRCGYCGSIMQRFVASYHTKIEYITCRNFGCTHHKYIQLKQLEQDILIELKEELKNYNYFIDNAQEEIKQLRKSKEREQNQLIKELLKKEAQVEKACSLLEQEIYTTEIFLKRTEKLKGEINAINTQLSELKNAPANDKIEIAQKSIPILENVLDKYENLDIEQKNKLLRAIIEKVIVTYDGKETKLNIELKI